VTRLMLPRGPRSCQNIFLANNTSEEVRSGGSGKAFGYGFHGAPGTVTWVQPVGSDSPRPLVGL